MFAGHDQALWQWLTGYPSVTGERLAGLWARHRAGEGAFGDLLVKEGELSECDLLAGLAPRLGYAWFSALPSTLSSELLARVPLAIAQHHRIIPVAVSGLEVTVVPLTMWPPTAREELTFALGDSIQLALADPKAVAVLWERYYGGGRKQSKAELEPGPADDLLRGADVTMLAGQGAVVALVNAVLQQAIRDRASDIHFEPFETELKIRFRLDGALHDLPSTKAELALPVISRLKVLANLDIAERRLPQDGRIRWTDAGKVVDLRVSTLPTQDGESVVLRVLDQRSGWLNLGQLGMPIAVRDGVEAVMRRPHGIFIVTGPTGSGKTTTLYSCLKQLNSSESKLLTIEDPVEYEIDGVMQVAVNPAAGLTFAKALRSFLRQDPDIVMVGEIRDAETAQIAIQAALTGHLVLTTLHTHDAASAVTRLVDMGIAPYLLAATLEGVLAQRLVRRLCKACKRAVPLDGATGDSLGRAGTSREITRTFFPTGCPHCHHTGYVGRCGLFEYLPISERLRDGITAGDSVQSLRSQGRQSGASSLREAGLAMILAGETSVDEVITAT